MSLSNETGDQTWSVYIIEDTIKHKYYVGACRDVNKRWTKHRHLARYPDRVKDFALYDEMRNRSLDDFTLTIIETGLSQRAALDLESSIIISENTLVPYGYNMQAKGAKRLDRDGLARHHTSETKARMSAAMSGRKQSPEHLAKLSAIRKGRTHSAESKAKLSKSLLATYKNPELRKHLSDIHKNMKRTEESKAKTRGSANGYALLNEESVRNIKIKIQEGWTHKRIAELIGVKAVTISAIASGRNWKHVTI